MKNIFLLFCLFPVFGFAQNSWYVNFSPGIDYVPPMPLVIKQSGFQRISFWADYETAPLKSPFYYSYRIGFLNEKNGWEAEMNHLKIYLRDNPDEVQRFSISHGYNQFFINHIKKLKEFEVKIGVGVVMAHPENTVRHQTLNEIRGLFNFGYCIAGPACQLGLFRRLSLSPGFYLFAESKVSLAYANVPVINGRAHAPVLAFHLQIGAGWFFIRKNNL